MKSLKKVFLAFAVVSAMTAAATTAALAADAQYNADTNTVTEYAKPEYEAGKQYTVLVVKQDDGETTDGATTATQENIYYIDQAADGTFTIKPMVGDGTLSDGTYEVRIGGEGIDTPIISTFNVGGEDPDPEPEYTLGDVNNSNGVINSTDANLALQHALNKVDLNTAIEGYNAFAAADVNGNSNVNSTDANLILQVALEKMTSDEFPAAKQ